MSIIEKPHFEAEDVPTSAELNLTYDLVSARTVGSENTQAGWASRDHVTDLAANQVFNFADETTVTTVYDRINFTTITGGLGDTKLDLNYQPETNEVLRVHASGLVTALEIESDFATGSDRGRHNYYAFRILLTYDDGGAPVQEAIATAGYSFTDRYRDTTYTPNPGQSMSLQYQTFQFSGLYSYTGAPATRTYQKIELQVAIFYGRVLGSPTVLNSVGIQRNQLQAIRPRR